MYAMKFFTLTEGGMDFTRAYSNVFPNRVLARSREGVNSDNLRIEASRYNRNMIVNEIRKVASPPVQLIHRNLLHEAILVSADLMKNARSEKVRADAAATLIRELKPADDQTINIKVNDGATDAIEELRKATETLAIQQHQSIQAGVAVQAIAESNIIEAQLDE